jgi:hypothetical protein
MTVATNISTMNWTSKVTLAALATAFVVLLRGNSRNVASEELKTRRNLALFDPRTLQDKTPVSSNNGESLEFVHIPRTGGTAIEVAAWSAKQILWGACHTSEGAHIGCGKPDWPRAFDWMGPSKRDRKYVGEPWLAPPTWLNPSPYANKDTFCVIRDPYDRMVSEYHANSYSTFHSSKDPRELNSWIQMKLREVMKISNYPGHFLPQHFYVYDHHRRQVVTHVLRYENLHMDFDNLMKRYNLDEIKLPPKPAHATDGAFFTKESLSPDTIAMINDIYRADFRIFGYPMVERPGQFAQVRMGTYSQIPAKLDKTALAPLLPHHDAESLAQQQSAMVGLQAPVAEQGSVGGATTQETVQIQVDLPQPSQPQVEAIVVR